MTSSRSIATGPRTNGYSQLTGTVEALIRRENARGIRSERIVLRDSPRAVPWRCFAGVRYPDKLAGIMGLSCYLLRAAHLAAERAAANQTTPVFLAH